LSNGYDVRWVGLNSNVKELNPIMSKEIPEDIAMIYHEQPPDSWLTSPFQKKICILPFETTRIPDSWINKVNSMDACLVPCKQNEQMMRDSGINVPISIIKWGVDENLFSYIDRPDDGIFTFGQCGALSERKGTDLLVKAFIKAFPPQEGAKVRLLLKTSHNVFTFGVKGERRIQVIMLPLDHDEFLRQFWNKVDCFVFPTRGEGAGLPPLEAMATGLPVIVTNWSGPADYINSDIGFPLNNYKMVPAEAFSKKLYKEDCGNWAEPDLDELVNTMRYAYYHQDECKEKGKKAAEYIKQNWLWKDTIHTFHDALDKYL
jgi:glycosyltransferase involved in cell wall biosynthesis